MKKVPTFSIDADFRTLVKESSPFKITGLTKDELGDCIDEWTPDRLRSVLADFRVSVHVSPYPNLNFISKNFRYEYMTISEFFNYVRSSNIKRQNVSPDSKNTSQTNGTDVQPNKVNGVQPEARRDREETSERNFFYYRSLGARPRKDPASLSSLHPYLEETFKFSEFLYENLGLHQHSTVFRLSQPGIELWTHYDALDNFLVQIHGSKHILLFPPSCMHKLGITDTSSPYHNICKVGLNKDNPELMSAYSEAYELYLHPGEVLFIPAAWPHAVESLASHTPNFTQELNGKLNNSVPEILNSNELNHVSYNPEISNEVENPSGAVGSEESDVCISVNVFVRNEDTDYPSRNVYGNEDPVFMKRACEMVRTDLQKLAKNLPVHFQKALWSKVAAIALDNLNLL